MSGVGGLPIYQNFNRTFLLYAQVDHQALWDFTTTSAGQTQPQKTESGCASCESGVMSAAATGSEKGERVPRLKPIELHGGSHR